MDWVLEKDISGFDVRRSAQADARYRREGYWRDETLADIARQKVEEDPSRTLLIDGNRQISRFAVWDGALRLSRFLLERGLQPGDVISFQLPNWAEASIISLAARMCGLVVTPVPPIYRESELGYILASSGAKSIFIPERFRGCDYPALLAGLRPQLPALRDVIVVRGEAGGDLGWGEAISGEPADHLPKVAASAVMMAMYTSGTTARPKGALHSHQTYGYKVRQMAEAWQITERDVFFMPSPVTHITGAFWCVDMPWVHGASSVLLDVWTAEDGIALIERHGCTLSGGATPFLQQLMEVARERPGAADSLRIFFCGGTTVAPDQIRKASATLPNCLFFRSYGCTEAPTTSMGISDRAEADLGADTDGRVLPPTEVRLVDDGGAPVAEGQEGEILVRGPELFLGYLNMQEASQFDDAGFFRTGDLGRLVNGDYLVITGRKKDLIIRSGENISPKEVEDVLLTHPGIAEVAIVAMPSEVTGEKGCAFVIARAGARIDLPAIRNFLEEAGLARQKFPEHLELVDDLPRVPSGKVRKDVLREEARRIAEALAGAPG